MIAGCAHCLMQPSNPAGQLLLLQRSFWPPAPCGSIFLRRRKRQQQQQQPTLLRQHRLRQSSIRISASGTAASSSDAEHLFVYAPVAGDSQSTTLYTALQTSDSEAESTGSFDAKGSFDPSGGDGGRGKGPRVPQRWRIVLAIGVPSLSSPPEAHEFRESSPREPCSSFVCRRHLTSPPHMC